MKKRIIVLALVLSMLASMFPVFAAEEAQVEQPLLTEEVQLQYDTEAYELLKYLQIIEMEPEALPNQITRGEFLKALDIMIGYGTYTSQEQLFSDMAVDDPYAPYINMLAKSGFITGYADGTIRLSEGITLDETLRLLLKAIGWDYFTDGNATAGQYYAQAQSADLLTGVTAGLNDLITGETAVTLLYNALTADLAEQTSFGEQDVEYTITEGNNLLYTIFGIVHLEGVLEGVDLTRLMGENDISPWHAVIDGVEVEYETNEIYDALGCAVSAYATEAEDGSLKLAFWVVSDDNEEVEIALEDIIEVGNGRLVAEQDGKERKYTYGSSVRILYNGASTGMLLSMDMFDGKNGSVRLIDNNRDGGYDVISVQAYKNYIVTDKDTTNSILYDASGDTSETIVLDTTVNDPYTIIYDEEGEEMKFSELDNNTVVSVYQSAEDAYQGYIRAYVSTQAIIGTVQEVINGGDSIMVNGETYELSAGAKEKSGSALTAGANVTLRMDIYGLVALVDLSPSTGMVYGFVSHAVMEHGFESGVNFKIFTQEGTFITAKAAEHIVIDGNRYTKDSTEILNALNRAAAQLFGSAPSGFCASLVRYRMDADGNISVMDTVLNKDGSAGSRYNGMEDTDDALYTMGGKTAERLQTGSPYWQLGASYFFDSTVPMFIYPSTLEELDDETLYDVTYGTNELLGGIQYTVTGFSSNGEKLMVEAMGMKTSDRSNDYASETKPAVVTGISEVVNEEGEELYAISMLDNAGLAKAYAEKDFAFSGLRDPNNEDVQLPMTVDQLKIGDFLRYRVDGDGIIKDITLYYRADGDIDVADLTIKDQYAACFRKGYILEKYDDGALICYTDDIADLENPDLSTCELLPAANTNASYYQFTPAEPGSSRTNPIVETATYETLKSYRTAGADCSKVVVHAVYLIPRTIYIVD